MNGRSPLAFARAAVAAAAFLLVVAGVRMPALAQAVTVSVGGHPLYLNPGPVERSGRVFVPLRGIFERLGATVVYDAGVINATKNETTVSLRIGSTQATIDGRHQYLDVAPFILGATTYVPLRFVAQSLGADVAYDPSTRSVGITMVRPPPPPVQPPPPVMPPPVYPGPPNPPPSSIVHLRAQQPQPNAYINDRLSTISADFTHQVDTGTVRVWLDGNNITNRAGLSSTGFSYRPPAPLTFGSHTVRVSGNDYAGSYFDRTWTFTTNGQPAPPPLGPIQLRAQQPQPGANVGNRFATISAEFSRVVNPGSVRVRLDGNNITGRSGVSASGFSYSPPAPLDFGSHTVRVDGNGQGGMAFDRSWSFSVAGQPSSPIELRGQTPQPGAQIQDRFATISARFSLNVNTDSVVVRLDGNNITSRSGVSATGFSYKPPAPLDRGSHTVRVTGRGLGGLSFDRQWSFSVQQGGPSILPIPGNIHLTISQPGQNQPVGQNFTVQGNTVANGRIRVTAGATPSSTGQFNGTAVAGPRGNFQLNVTLQRMMGQQSVTIRIHATDPVSQASTEKTMQLRLQ